MSEMDEVKPQRRGRRIAMTDEELADFLATERTCRVATVGTDGPHATPLWFGWDGSYLWLYSIVKSQRWTDLMRDPRIGVVVDAGVEYLELRGVEITGTVEVIGDAPRTGGTHERAAGVEGGFWAPKNGGGGFPRGRAPGGRGGAEKKGRGG